MAAVAVVLLAVACSTAGESATIETPTVASTIEPSARPLEERDGAQRALRSTDLSISATVISELEITVTNRGPNPGIDVVVDVRIDHGDLVVDDARCEAMPSGFRCTITELLARAATVVAFRGDSAAGSAAVTHDGPELDSSDNTVDFG